MPAPNQAVARPEEKRHSANSLFQSEGFYSVPQGQVTVD
jgi:hypothetical protein